MQNYLQFVGYNLVLCTPVAQKLYDIAEISYGEDRYGKDITNVRNSANFYTEPPLRKQEQCYLRTAVRT